MNGGNRRQRVSSRFTWKRNGPKSKQRPPRRCPVSGEVVKWLIAQSRMTRRLQWSHIYSALSLCLWYTLLQGHIPHCIIMKQGSRKKKQSAITRMHEKRTCYGYSGGKKKATKNSDSAVITRSIRTQLHTSHHNSLRCSQDWLTCVLTLVYTCFSEQKKKPTTV